MVTRAPRQRTIPAKQRRAIGEADDWVGHELSTNMLA
jgi:hypothetical protein